MKEVEKKAVLHRMVMPDHMCPHGLKAKDLLEKKGFRVEDRHIKTRNEADAFRREHGVKTTPQVIIDGDWIGGFDDLNAYLGRAPRSENATTYAPVIALFSIAALLSVVMTWLVHDTLFRGQTVGWAIATAMVLLGLQKLQDLETFTNMFVTYDLLAQRWVRYSYIYPFVETGAGLLMLMGVLTWVAAPAAFSVAGIGALSVAKAVYIDKRELKCACVGDSRVPLGFVSLTENLMMMGMAVWMIV